MPFVLGEILASVETVVLLSHQKPDDYIEVNLDLDEMDLTSAEAEATNGQIKQYCREQFDLNVSTLYISQIKRKYGIIERECYNKPKNVDARVPQCPPEKERAITAALQHFKMI